VLKSLPFWVLAQIVLLNSVMTFFASLQQDVKSNLAVEHLVAAAAFAAVVPCKKNDAYQCILYERFSVDLKFAIALQGC